MAWYLVKGEGTINFAVFSSVGISLYGSTTLQSFVSSKGTFAATVADDEATGRHNHLLYIATKRQDKGKMNFETMCFLNMPLNYSQESSDTIVKA